MENSTQNYMSICTYIGMNSTDISTGSMSVIVWTLSSSKRHIIIIISYFLMQIVVVCVGHVNSICH